MIIIKSWLLVSKLINGLLLGIFQICFIYQKPRKVITLPHRLRRRESLPAQSAEFPSLSFSSYVIYYKGIPFLDKIKLNDVNIKVDSMRRWGSLLLLGTKELYIWKRKEKIIRALTEGENSTWTIRLSIYFLCLKNRIERIPSGMRREWKKGGNNARVKGGKVLSSSGAM